MDDLTHPTYNEDDLEYLQDANNELRESNSILNAIIDALHEHIDELQQRLGIDDGPIPPAAALCSICGAALPTNEIQTRHMAYHRFEINECRKKNGLQPYDLTNTATANEAGVVVSGKKRKEEKRIRRPRPVVREKDLPSPPPPSPVKGTIKVSKRKRRVSEGAEGFADDESPPRPDGAAKRKKVVRKDRILVKAKKVASLVRRGAGTNGSEPRKR